MSEDGEELAALKPNSLSGIKIFKNEINLDKRKENSWFLRRIYILTWIRKYNRNFALSDLIAGVTLGLTIIPQSLAYATLAGIPSQYGLYAAFMGSLIYVFFGTIKEVSIGPTSLMAILTLQYTSNKPVEYAIALAFMAGIVELLMGLLRLGFIVDFISAPVTSAFTSATALIIVGSQITNLIGIVRPKSDVYITEEQRQEMVTPNLGDSLLGLFCIIFLLSLKFMCNIPTLKKNRIIKKIVWYISISRNALAVFITSVIAYYWCHNSESGAPFVLSDHVEAGVPSFQLPPFEIQHNNATLNIIGICSELGTGIIVVPLVAVLANVAIAKSFAVGGIVDASQEMLTLGLCNLIGSCFKSMPTCGAFTRSAVSQASGVKTPMAGIYSGIMVILALSLLTPYFHYIPKSTLAAVLISAVIFMVDFKIIFRLWKQNKRDLIGWFGCFLVCLIFGVEQGLLFGMILNIFHLLLRWSRPEIEVKLDEIDLMQYISIVPKAPILFPGIDYLREKISIACSAIDYQIPVVIDCTRISEIDYTAAQGIHSLAKELNKNSSFLVLENMEPKLQHHIDTSHEILFCNKLSALKEMLIQENIRRGRIPIEDHIRSSMDIKIEADDK